MVLEFRADNTPPAFALIDSNRTSDDESPGLTKLRQLGAEELDFVALTHAHADHYRGMARVLKHYTGRVSSFYSFPIDRDREALKRMAASYYAQVEGSEDAESIKSAFELADIFKLASEIPEWISLTGLGAKIYAPGFTGVEFSLILPPSRVRGDIFKAIQEDKSPYLGEKHNKVSLALLVEYAGVRIVLGGDGTKENWMFERQRYPKDHGEAFGSMKADASKLPHHGSHIDCDDFVLDFIYGDDAIDPALAEKIALISASGKGHPSSKVLQSLSERGIHPYCTNMSPICEDPTAFVSSYIAAQGIDPALVSVMNKNLGDRTKGKSCQGDITLTVNGSGEIAVDRQFKVACPLRGDYIELNLLTS